MARLKKKRSLHIDRAQARLASVVAIHPEIDLGAGITAQSYEELIARTRQALVDYNTLLSHLDGAYHTFKALEQTLADMSARVLTGVATHYGKESTEYEMAGGTRTSQRRRRKRKALPSDNSSS